VIIIATSIAYLRSAFVRGLIQPVLHFARIPMNVFAAIAGFFLRGLLFPFRAISGIFRRA
jgi:hypothetical protein